MRCLRSKTWLNWIGLAALAVQFVFAFGHHHALHQDHKHHEVHTAAVTPLPSISDAGQHHDHAHDHVHQHVAHNGASHGSNHNDPRHSDHDAPEHHCPTCWTLSLLAALVLPVLAALGLFSPVQQRLAPRRRSALIAHGGSSNYFARGQPAVSFC